MSKSLIIFGVILSVAMAVIISLYVLLKQDYSYISKKLIETRDDLDIANIHVQIKTAEITYYKNIMKDQKHTSINVNTCKENENVIYGDDNNYYKKYNSIINFIPCTSSIIGEWIYDDSVGENVHEFININVNKYVKDNLIVHIYNEGSNYQELNVDLMIDNNIDNTQLNLHNINNKNIDIPNNGTIKDNITNKVYKTGTLEYNISMLKNLMNIRKIGHLNIYVNNERDFKSDFYESPNKESYDEIKKIIYTTEDILGNLFAICQLSQNKLILLLDNMRCISLKK